MFEEGAFVYVGYGAVLGGLGGLLWWAPKWTGRVVPEKPALGLSLLGVLATILASLPYYAAGWFDQPAATVEFDYDGPSELWNIAVTAGHALMALVVVALVGLVLRSTRGGDPGGDDPWGGQTLEWLTMSPAPATLNFAETPTVMSPSRCSTCTAPRGRLDEGHRRSRGPSAMKPCPPRRSAPPPCPARLLDRHRVCRGGDADAHGRDDRHLDPDA